MMKDQYNMDQYIKETSQIHAPIDLIRRTKEAVREEEQRIQREKAGQTGQNAMAYASKTVSAATNNIYGKVYRWALPVAAAVFSVVLLNIFAMRLVGRGDKSFSGAAMDMAEGEQLSNDMTMHFAESDMADMLDDAAESADAGNNGDVWSAGAAGESAAAAVAEEKVAEAAEAAASDSYEENEFDSQNYVQKSEVTEDYIDEAAADEPESGENEDTSLSISEIEEIPDFMDDKNTQCITAHGLRFYVVREWGSEWSAYVRVDGAGYVITGDSEEITDRESFVEKAYQLLAETVEGIE